MDRQTVIVLALLIAPVPLVLMVALVRGYTVTIHLAREEERRRRRDE